jgi:hypothetical protein
MVAEHLPKTDLVGSIDPYVKFSETLSRAKLLPTSRTESSVKKK